MVWQAYLKVKKGGKSAGVDLVCMEEFDANRSKHLYKLWNRMASGSYFPPPVKETEIPKKDGKVRKLGISMLLSYYFLLQFYVGMYLPEQIYG